MVTQAIRRVTDIRIFRTKRGNNLLESSDTWHGYQSEHNGANQSLSDKIIKIAAYIPCLLFNIASQCLKFCNLSEKTHPDY